MALGDLEGIVVTGLTAAGLFLIQNYVDRSGDFQTAALAASFVHHSLVPPASSQADRWIETYRLLLDSWHLYASRANLDISLGQRLRAAGESGLTDPDRARRFAPPSILVRCHFCDTVITPQLLVGVVMGGGAPGGPPGGQATTVVTGPVGGGGSAGTATAKRVAIPVPSTRTKVRFSDLG
jgi:hypothetical protein